ncbi:hypothetical protein Bcop_1702 [Bacteroides coprosuis DSM 18011]|uniref:Lipoprotein n=1 Tax=Bacteroides coprosuis DSM 18011 TaxID=679937 RepID=F3ZR21_9BACE|nr:hypothetical protein [Bacteroides coprosuis]EGJ71894.1 hypothetical protein Bcop_1702 [Bacteroides coprosuis DSM 18011]
MNIKYILFSLILALVITSCSGDLDILKEGGGDSDVSVSLQLDYADFESKSTTRTNTTDNKELYLFLFDEDGLWITYRKQDYTPSASLSFSLPSSVQKRIIHLALVEKGSLDALFNLESSSDNEGKDEGEVITHINGEQAMYWQRIVVPSLKPNTHLGTIQLLRNQARISILNETSTFERFEILGFSIHNAPQKGTLAPFDGQKKLFTQDVITESYPLELQSFAPMDKNGVLAVSADEVEFTPAHQAFDLFERHRSTAENNLYVILKVSFQGQECYYKLGFHDSKALTRLDIHRNTHYSIKIKAVSQKGYSDLQEAVNNAPAENASLSVLLDEYPKITDGYTSLKVDRTFYIYNEPNNDFWVDYTFSSNGDSFPYTEKDIEITLIQNQGEEVLNPTTFYYNVLLSKEEKKITGTIRAKSYWILPDLKTHIGEVRIKAGDLMRTIKIEFGHKRVLDARLISYGDKSDDEVVIQLNIPKEEIVSEAIFPIKFLIESKYLYPNTDAGKNSNLVIQGLENGLYVYQFMVKEAGEHNIYFKRTLSNKSELVSVYSDYYQLKELQVSASNSTPIYSARGNIYYKEADNKPLPMSAKVVVSPSYVPRSLLVYENGKYRFQFEKKKADSSEYVSISSRLTDGTSYKKEVYYSSLLQNRDIILEPYLISTVGDVYYLRGNNYSILDMRYYHIEADGHPEIKFIRHRESAYVNNIEIRIPSNIPDNTLLRLRNSYNNQVLMITAGELKKGGSIAFRNR